MAKATVIAAQPEAADAGVAILDAGGNAVDAAVACAMVQGVVDPQMCGIGGFGSLLLHIPRSRAIVNVDFHARVPLAARADMWESKILCEMDDGFGFALDGKMNDIGWNSICTPGTLLGFSEVHREYGRLSWPALLAPAIRCAEDGFRVRPHVSYCWNHKDKKGLRANNADRLRVTNYGRSIYCEPDGSPKRLGDRVCNPELAETLREVASEGADTFYKGSMAARICDSVKQNGGMLSDEDLRSYQTSWGAPVGTSYRNIQLFSNRPPGGGVSLAEMLNIAECFPLSGMRHNSAEYIHLMVEVMKFGCLDRERYVGDPRFVDAPIELLTDKGYASAIAERIKLGERAVVPRFAINPPTDTTQLITYDDEGWLVTSTHSLGNPSGAIPDGLGFMLNGCMSAFDPRPGHVNSIAPGKSRTSGICPTIGLRNNHPYLAVGAPGGANIITSVFSTILNVVDFRMSAIEAVVAPRFSATGRSVLFQNRFPSAVIEELRDQGYPCVISESGYGPSGVHLMLIGDGVMSGAADPAYDGVVYQT